MLFFGLSLTIYAKPINQYKEYTLGMTLDEFQTIVKSLQNNSISDDTPIEINGIRLGTSISIKDNLENETEFYFYNDKLMEIKVHPARGTQMSRTEIDAYLSKLVDTYGKYDTALKYDKKGIFNDKIISTLYKWIKGEYWIEFELNMLSVSIVFCDDKAVKSYDDLVKRIEKEKQEKELKEEKNKISF